MPERTTVFMAYVILVFVTAQSCSRPRPITFAERVDRYILSFPDYQEFQGVILISLGDKILFHRGFGLASREFSVPNGAGTPFQVGSITKAFSGILALRMAEEGLLKLDATICDYLTDYPADPGKRITVRHLLSNTSGIPHHIDALPDYWISADLFMTPLEKDLFGFERGFVKFSRDAAGSISGFKLMTRDVDAFLGSKFVRISPD